VWTAGVHCKRVLVGKHQRGVPEGARTPHVQELSAVKVTGAITAAVQPSAAVTKGMICEREVDMMLDTGSSISLIEESVAAAFSREDIIPSNVKLVSAAGNSIPVLGCITLPIQLGNLTARHSLVVVRSLISPVILGLDFLQTNEIVLDFTSKALKISTLHSNTSSGGHLQELLPLFDANRKAKAKICAVEMLTEPSEEVVDDCAVPLFGESVCSKYDMPSCVTPTFLPILEQYKTLFLTSPGSTTLAKHFIPTTGIPVKVPPRRIPANYRTAVESQIQAMLKEGIIEESSSPWLALAVFVRKKTGDIRICVDYRELNKRTVKDAYPLPRSDEVQDQFSGSVIFSTLDLQSGYWQLPVNETDRAKTAFCPGPGLGLFQFCRMPFGLSGAPASFQRLMDTILRDLSFVTTYIDDVLVYSSSIEEHKKTP